MRQRLRSRLAERWRRLRRPLAIWRRRDPQPWVVALLGLAMGLGVFLMMLAWVAALRLVADVVRSLR